MNATKHRKLAGLLFVVGAVLINVPYTLLIMGFDYPDILRQAAETILTRYQQGGPGLTLTSLPDARQDGRCPREIERKQPGRKS